VVITSGGTRRGVAGVGKSGRGPELIGLKGIENGQSSNEELSALEII
jgi:hypothetical protein